MMICGFKFIKNMRNFTVFINKKTDSVNTIKSASHKISFPPHTSKLLGDFDDLRSD